MKIQADSLKMNWTEHDSGLQVCVIDFDGFVVDGDNEIKVKPGDELFRQTVGELKIMEAHNASKHKKGKGRLSGKHTGGSKGKKNDKEESRKPEKVVERDRARVQTEQEENEKS